MERMRADSSHAWGYSCRTMRSLRRKEKKNKRTSHPQGSKNNSWDTWYPNQKSPVLWSAITIVPLGELQHIVLIMVGACRHSYGRSYRSLKPEYRPELCRTAQNFPRFWNQELQTIIPSTNHHQTRPLPIPPSKHRRSPERGS